MKPSSTHIISKNTYPFGMAMKGRSYEAGKYRYGFNNQEKDDELYGDGNSTNAEYWQYDARLGRRWNVDPVKTSWESPFATNGNNPIYYNDPNGDFKTWFGAALYSALHGGKVSKNSEAAAVDKFGKWNVEVKRKNAKTDVTATTSGKTEDGHEYIDPVQVQGKTISVQGWGKTSSNSGGGNSFYGVSNKLKNGFNSIWYSPLARFAFKDYYQFSYGGTAGVLGTVSIQRNFTLMLRGKDIGLYENQTLNYSDGTTIGAVTKISFGGGYYLGDAHNLKTDLIEGIGVEGSLGLSVGEGYIIGIGVEGSVGGWERQKPKINNWGYANPKILETKSYVEFGLGGVLPIWIDANIGIGNSTKMNKIF